MDTCPPSPFMHIPAFPLTPPHYTLWASSSRQLFQAPQEGPQTENVSLGLSVRVLSLMQCTTVMLLRILTGSNFTTNIQHVSKIILYTQDMEIWPILKKRKSINAKPKMTQTLELSVKSYRAAILTIITMLHEVKINALVIDGKIDILSRELETIEKNE